MRHGRVCPTRCFGFTIVELLVVISIIAVLMAILLPAIGAAREAARQSTCINNLKQVGIATQGFHSAHNVLPPCVEDRDGSSDADANWGWLTPLLPYLEMKNESAALQLGSGISLETIATTPASYPNFLTIAQQPVPLFLCPSAGSNNALAASSFKGVAYPRAFARANYAASLGVTVAQNNSTNFRRGAMPMREGHSFAAIKDGLTHTILAGEVVARGTPEYHANWIGCDEVPGDGSKCASTSRSEYYPMNGTDNLSTIHSFASAHSGGCNFLMCDGAARFIDNAVEFGVEPSGATNFNWFGVYQKLGMRDDGLLMPVY